MMKRLLCIAVAVCSQAVVIGAAVTPARAQELVFNGGFETGNFLGWNVPPNAPPPNGALFRIGTGGAHSGSHYAGISSASQQYISQTLPTQAGQDYLLSFWLRWDFGMQNERVTVRWEGQPVLHVQGTLDAAPWTHFMFPLHSNITGSFLEFGQNAFPGEFHIDDISVTPVPAPSAAPLLLLGSAVALRRRRH